MRDRFRRDIEDPTVRLNRIVVDPDNHRTRRANETLNENLQRLSSQLQPQGKKS